MTTNRHLFAILLLLRYAKGASQTTDRHLFVNRSLARGFRNSFWLPVVSLYLSFYGRSPFAGIGGCYGADSCEDDLHAFVKCLVAVGVFCCFHPDASVGFRF